MENLPTYTALVFSITTAITIMLFFKASHYSKLTLTLLIFWTAIQGIVAYSGFYTITQTLPPRFALLIIPPALLIIYLFNSPLGKKYIDGLNFKTLTLIHIVRIPVELVLLALFLDQKIPEVMTFEGRNFDIIAGITAPMVYYFTFTTQNKKILLAWNTICLLLLINIVLHAILAAPTPFQQIAFDQPNIAVFYYPFIWLPCCIVPIVLFAHLASLRQLLKRQQ